MNTQINAQRLLPAPRQPKALLYPARQPVSVRLAMRRREDNSRVTWAGLPLAELASRVGRYAMALDSDGSSTDLWRFCDGSAMTRDVLGVLAFWRSASDVDVEILASE